MQKALLYVASLVVLLTAAFLVWSKAPRLEEPQMATTTAPVEMRVVEHREETDTYTIDVRYPQLGAQFGTASIDLLIKAKVDRAVAAFKDYPTDRQANSALPKNELLVTFDSVYVGKDYVSVELLVSEYTGGAHPNSAIIAANAEIISGRQLTLEDALSLVGMSLLDVATETRTQLSEKLGDAFFEEGASPTPANYATFLVNEHEVAFIFNNYQVAPYAAGPQSVSFPRVEKGY